ncbi:hydroxyisourate hydrolase [Paracoccus methylarcula]|uniref:5-hydroxyisourate hydrolase n=1 Tax=Paracoccus methylarcula TaxID=72022 RepID=A0A3R7P4C0_9RHOB|nr:hydroxyisourate hydrolase [Paracoccus methylarcula]RNF34348.1 5-hydroxyisourate hydrolase [Paracoccus methylarcula]
MEFPDMNRREFVTGLGIGAAGLSAIYGDGTLVSPAHAATQATGGQLTLHAIDTHFGQTRADLQIDLSMQDADGTYQFVKSVTTVERGRTENPVLEPGELRIGRYELLMYLDDYFARFATELPNPPFLGKVPIRFGVFDGSQNFHVPILFSPWSYSYYRGS